MLSYVISCFINCDYELSWGLRLLLFCPLSLELSRARVPLHASDCKSSSTYTIPPLKTMKHARVMLGFVVDRTRPTTHEIPGSINACAMLPHRRVPLCTLTQSIRMCTAIVPCICQPCHGSHPRRNPYFSIHERTPQCAHNH